MPAIQEIGPTSTPQRYLENQYQLLQNRTANWERNLRAQKLAPEEYANAVKDMQEQLNGQISAFQAKAQELQQTQSMIDLGLIDDPVAGAEAMWAAVLPEEVKKAMYPKQPEVSKREPFSVKEMQEFSKEKGSIEQFASQTPQTVTKRYGIGGYDWIKRDIKTRPQAAIMEKYRAWKTFIGYGALTPTEKRQVDGEWDSWIAGKGKSWKWDTTSKPIRAERATGPFTRSYGRQFRQTPTGPREATNPLQLSIAQTLPKKKQQKTAEELRKENTPEAYELGKQLGYWN